MPCELHLSEWAAWSQRHTQPDCAGVYVIGRGNEPVVLYIGRTWGSGGLKDRIRAFNRSATTGVKGHAGGVTYFHKLGPSVSDLMVKFHVPVAINPDEKILRPYIEYAERRLIWEHVVITGALPECNTE